VTDTTVDWSQHPDSWGRWGDDDERGALNLLSPETVLRATRVCRTGKVYRLALPLQRLGVPIVPYRGAPQRLSLLAADDELLRRVGVPDDAGACEDVLVLPSHSVTHMDALSHVFANGQFYNGFPANSFHTNSGAAHCGIEKNGGFAGRAVLLDVAAHHDVPWLEVGHAIDGAQLEACAIAQGVGVGRADIVLVRTGWVERFLDSTARGQELAPGQPGLDLDAARWLVERDVAAVGADNSGIEQLPFPKDQGLAVHIELLVRRGITLVEHLLLADMSADRCHEGLFMVAPLLVPGAAGSPVTPLVIG
jgi:kynurenine formamidase